MGLECMVRLQINSVRNGIYIQGGSKWEQYNSCIYIGCRTLHKEHKPACLC